MLLLPQTVMCCVCSMVGKCTKIGFELHKPKDYFSINGCDLIVHYYRDILAKTLKSLLQKNGMSYPWFLIASLYCIWI